MKIYYDTDDNRIISEETLFAEFKELKEGNHTECETYSEYIESCLKGTLELRKVPELCYALYPAMRGKGDLIIIRFGEMGYYLTSCPKGDCTKKDVDVCNGRLGVSSAEAKAMHVMSMRPKNSNWNDFFEVVQRFEEREEA